MKEFPSEMILKYPRSGYLNSAFCILNSALCRLGGTTNYNLNSWTPINFAGIQLFSELTENSGESL
jgi:hypothetical protein